MVQESGDQRVHVVRALRVVRQQLAEVARVERAGIDPSGPVTNTRPPGPITTMSVSAGPYAAPPAAGPSTIETCGTRPDARTIAAKTCPTASSASTPSASRAPPECHSPT